MAAEKRDKRSVSYTDRADKGKDHCELCRHFEPPGSCELVRGTISPEGWCELFKAKSDTDSEKGDTADELREALAAIWNFYFQAHSFHWNVQGENFVQLHEFFRSLYFDAWYEVDRLAEELRSLGVYAPTSPAEISKDSEITFAEGDPPDARAMTQKLADDNEIVIQELDDAQEAAVAAKEQGLANRLQEMIDQHKKSGWMLKALLSETSVKEIAKRPRDTRLGALLEKAGGPG